MSEIKALNGITLQPNRGFAISLIWTGVLGWLASFALVLERIHVATNPNATLSCDLNPFISCKSVMLTAQAKLFGFPNPLIGLSAFMFPIAVGAAILAGARFPRWFWNTFMVGITAGFVFVIWLAHEAIFDIGALCPYCMVAWVATLLVLSVLLRELVELKKQKTTDEDQIIAIDTIKKFLVPFHVLWAALLVGSAFLGV